MANKAAASPQTMFADVLHLIRAGDFLAVLQNASAMAVLRQAAKEESVDDMSCLRASVMLAETYDQTSQYDEAERYLRFDEKAADALERLEAFTVEVERSTAVPSGPARPEQEKSRPHMRALAFFCLQCAIALHRRTESASLAVRKAIRLAEDACRCLERLSSRGYRFDGTLSMFFYWMGRFHLVNRNWKDARESFQISMRHEHDNLRHHLARHAEGRHGEQESPDGCAICSNKVAYTNYLLASNMAFGLALIEMEEGTVEKALTLLRPAMIMLDGSTRDSYRKGYIRLLIGRAERVRAGAQSGPLQRALQLLEEARVLFLQNDAHNAAHLFYAARALHQLCIGSMFMARDHTITPEEREAALLKAVRYFIQSLSQYRREEGEELKQYVDHRLEVRLALTKTRLLGQVLKACATWPGAGVQDKLQAWMHQCSAAADLSQAWGRHGRISSLRADDERILGDLAAELLGTMLQAGITDDKLSGDESGRSYVLLAEAEAVAAVVQFGGWKVDLKLIEGFLRRLGVLRSNRALLQKAGETIDSQAWKQAALTAAIARVRGLLKHQTLKVQATAEVTLAQLLFLSSTDGPAEAHNQLLHGWEPIKHQVENQILHNAVDELLRTSVPPPLICVIPMKSADGPRSFDQMVEELQKQSVTKLDQAGLTGPEVSEWLKRAQNAIRDWKVEGYPRSSRGKTRRKQV